MSQRIDTKTQYIKKLNTLKSSLNQLVIDSLFFFISWIANFGDPARKCTSIGMHKLNRGTRELEGFR